VYLGPDHSVFVCGGGGGGGRLSHLKVVDKLRGYLNPTVLNGSAALLQYTSMSCLPHGPFRRW
jgi:hypothetical protein